MMNAHQHFQMKTNVQKWKINRKCQMMKAPVIFNFYVGLDFGCHTRLRMKRHIRPELNSRSKWWWNTETPPLNRTKCLSFIFDDTHFTFGIAAHLTLTINHSIYIYTSCCCYCCQFICIRKKLFFLFRKIFSNADEFSSHVC